MSAASKPRVRVITDGRIGWPDVVQYELLDGPKKGRMLTCPPMVETDHDPAVTTQRRSYPFRIVVRDAAAYQALRTTGAVNNRRHTGAGRVEDNRATPGA